MCLAVPAQLVQIHSDQEATADLHGNRLRINLALVPEARVGDWVLVHAGFAIQKLDPKEAAEIWSLLSDLTAPHSSSPLDAGSGESR